MINLLATGRPYFMRLALSIILGVLLLQGAAFYLYGHERMVQTAETFAMGVAERAYAIDSILKEQPELLDYFQSPFFRLTRIDTLPDVPRRLWPHNDEIAQAVHTHLISLGLVDTEQVRIWYVARRGPSYLHLVFPSVKGDFLQVIADTKVTSFPHSFAVTAWMTSLALLIIVVVLVTTRRLTRHLPGFVNAAERLGNGQVGDALPEQVGPKELRRVTVAFNNMQHRVLRLLEERSNMLAGISHDLRTLCTRLKLRVESIAVADQRLKAEADIALMTGILDQSLAFARDEHSEEGMGRVDLCSLLQSLVDELVDAEQEIHFDSKGDYVVQGQPLAINRLFTNLIDNAVKYGGDVEVTIIETAVQITDSGEGFPQENLEQALQPYMRLVQARSQMVPGTGLGLTIARNVCNRHGWQLRFEQLRPGFRVSVLFN